MLTREQKYAAAIYRQVEAVKNDRQTNNDEYKSMAEKLPVLIRSAGLTQALHFADSRDSAASKKLVGHLAKVVSRPADAALDEQELKKKLLNESRTAPINEYIYLTEKVLTALQWYKRFAKSLPEETNDSTVTTDTEAAIADGEPK